MFYLALISDNLQWNWKKTNKQKKWEAKLHHSVWQSQGRLCPRNSLLFAGKSILQIVWQMKNKSGLLLPQLMFTMTSELKNCTQPKIDRKNFPSFFKQTNKQQINSKDLFKDKQTNSNDTKTQNKKQRTYSFLTKTFLVYREIVYNLTV